VAACGSSSSNTGTSSGTKPAYCQTLATLQTTVHDLTHLSVSGGVTALLAEVTKLQSDATTLVNQAKGDFPAETSTLQSAVSKFQTEAKSLSSSPSTGQIASVATAAIGVVNAVKGLADSARTKCS
jgi:hypothetical protein